MMKLATLGNGCFWCTEAVFQDFKGVVEVVSGYCGGHVEHPTYEQVCGKQTGHAEVLQIKFDEIVISFQELLEVFFATHDPTTLNRQGNDVGPQYRSAIFYHDNEQKEQAETFIKQIDNSDIFDSAIVTEVSPFGTFYAAEDYHQNYYNLNGHAPYCQAVVSPKVRLTKELFRDQLK